MSRRGVLVLAVAVALVAGIGYAVARPDDERQVTAYFSRAVQVYPGSEVRILGVPVGEVTAVVPEGTSVRVEMTYSAEHTLAADAKAVIITPTLTADRFVQLTPAWRDGPELADGGTIEVRDTGTPVELDRIYRSLSDVSRALGPRGANSDGSLDRVLQAGAGLLEGQGRRFGRTLRDMSQLVSTFDSGRGDLFGTVRRLEQVTGVLARNDATVSRFIGDLGDVTGQLGADGEELRAALANLAAIVGTVESFVKDNRTKLVGGVEKLNRVLQVLVDEKSSLEAALTAGPLAMGNLSNAWDAPSQSVGSRLIVDGSVQNVDGFLCALVRNGQIPSAQAACTLFEALFSPVTEEGTGGQGPAPTSAVPRPPKALRGTVGATSVAELLGGVR